MSTADLTLTRFLVCCVAAGIVLGSVITGVVAVRRDSRPTAQVAVAMAGIGLLALIAALPIR